ncbi:MAG: DUF4911 domain-containing protein [bacterium]
MHIVGRVLRVYPGSGSSRIAVELQEDLAVGEAVRFIFSGENQAEEQQAARQMIITRMESEEGQRIYRAGRGEQVVLFSDVPVQPSDTVEKVQPQEGCLRIVALIKPADICFLNGLMEGHGDIAVLRTLDGSLGLVELLASASYQEEMHELLLSLRQKEMFLEIKAVIHGATSL